MRIDWSARATRDVYAIQSYIEKQHIAASYETVERISNAVNSRS